MKNMVVDCLDKLEQIIESGVSVPIVGKKVIDKIEALELIDQIRILLPEEMKQATLSSDKNNITAKQVIPQELPKPQAKKELPPNLAGHELVVAARSESLRILDEARKEAREIKAGADEYAESTLTALEDTLNRTARIVRKGIDELGRRKNPIQTPQTGSTGSFTRIK